MVRSLLQRGNHIRTMGNQERTRQLIAPDGARISYWVIGHRSGPSPALLLLHGAASNHTRWSEFVEKTSLKESWGLIRPDLRGNGASMMRGRLDIETWCDDLARILEAEGYAQAIIIGHSLGAQIGLFFAERFSARTAGLVLIDPLFRPALIGKKRRTSRLGPVYRGAAIVVRALNRLGLRRREIPNRDLRELDEETRAALLNERSREELAKKYSSLRIILKYMPTANYLQQAAEMLRWPPAFERIGVPVLVLLSTGSTFSDPTVVRREIGRFPNADAIDIPAHHWPLTEEPDQVRTAIEGWLTARRPAKSR